MAVLELLLLLLVLAAAAWAARTVPRWTGEGYRVPTGPEREDWSADGLPSRPYGDLRRVTSAASGTLVRDIVDLREHDMSKRARKRRGRKKNSANHGNRPNS